MSFSGTHRALLGKRFKIGETRVNVRSLRVVVGITAGLLCLVAASHATESSPVGMTVACSEVDRSGDFYGWRFTFNEGGSVVEDYYDYPQEMAAKRPTVPNIPMSWTQNGATITVYPPYRLGGRLSLNVAHRGEFQATRIDDYGRTSRPRCIVETRPPNAERHSNNLPKEDPQDECRARVSTLRHELVQPQRTLEDAVVKIMSKVQVSCEHGAFGSLTYKVVTTERLDGPDERREHETFELWKIISGRQEVVVETSLELGKLGNRGLKIDLNFAELINWECRCGTSITTSTADKSRDLDRKIDSVGKLFLEKAPAEREAHAKREEVKQRVLRQCPPGSYETPKCVALVQEVYDVEAKFHKLNDEMRGLKRELEGLQKERSALESKEP